MPSEKTHRAQVRRAARTKAVRSFTRNRLVEARTLASQTDSSAEETAESVKKAISALDRASRKGVIHPNEAARKKSRLQKKLNASAAS
jgi:small subunit ribosomal protein S20